jgi:hypothetical protein
MSTPKPFGTGQEINDTVIHKSSLHLSSKLTPLFGSIAFNTYDSLGILHARVRRSNQ